jgi:DNA mismatch repair protein MutS2
MFQAGPALEFARVLDGVAGFAAGPLGADRIRARRPGADPAWVEAELAPVAQLLAWYRRGHTLDIPPVPDLAPILERLRLPGAVLDGLELIAVRDTLGVIRTVQNELRKLQPEVPRLADWILPVPARGIEKRLVQALGEDGEVRDGASPALLRARRAVQECRSRLVRKLEAILREQTRPGDAPAEVTVRNGRYVIPVRRDARGRPDGIVHDESATGETLFVEPAAAIEAGNDLRRAIAEAEREALRVLRELTEALRPEADEIARAHAACVALDDLNARTRYALSVGADVPAVRPPGDGLVLCQARHPLLLAKGSDPVPFDLTLAGGERTLLISGPNAGGKTVLLKTIGLVAAMLQSGIVPPLGAGSALPVFDRIVADIGDHQSIAADLSTFSAHLAVLRTLLAEAGPGTLVLVDEIGSGTDPSEGGALAAAALLALTRSGALTVATTHLGSLKALADESPGIVNGSLQFDPDRLAPTFRFAKGTPGRSYGIAMARRLGIPAEIVAVAEGRVSGVERSLDALLEAAERRERELAAEQAVLADRLAAMEQEAARLAAELAAVEAREAEVRVRERTAEQRARTDARRMLIAARAEVEAALRAAREAADLEAASQVRRQLEGAIRREGEAIHRLDPEAVSRVPASAGFTTGQSVRLPSGATGRVLEVRDDGRALVVAGNVKLVVPREELAPAPERRAEPDRSRTLPTPAARGPGRSEIDLRGMRADEAEAMTLSALDAAVEDDLPYLRIIHGMGTGALREAVRRVLSRDPRVSRFAFAPANQGGVGVTVAEFTP